MPLVAKIAIAAVVALLLGLVIGFFIGRFSMEQKWSQPYAVLTPADATRAAVDADPTPPAGTKIIKPMPIGRTRVALAALTKNDPAVSKTSSFGADDKGVELHVTIENHGACKITGARGVAYGFDALGHAAAANKHGEHYLAFKLESPIEPGKKAVAAEKLRFADDVTLALAQIDATECEGGGGWKRP